MFENKMLFLFITITLLSTTYCLPVEEPEKKIDEPAEGALALPAKEEIPAHLAPQAVAEGNTKVFLPVNTGEPRPVQIGGADYGGEEPTDLAGSPDANPAAGDAVDLETDNTFGFGYYRPYWRSWSYPRWGGYNNYYPSWGGYGYGGRSYGWGRGWGSGWGGGWGGYGGGWRRYW